MGGPKSYLILNFYGKSYFILKFWSSYLILALLVDFFLEAQKIWCVAPKI